MALKLSCRRQRPTKGLSTLNAEHEGLAAGEVWPQAGRVTAHLWMTHPSRPEGTDNGQSLLTLALCQNVSTFTHIMSAPYMVRHRQRRTILRSRKMQVGYRWRGRAGQAALHLLTRGRIVFGVSRGPPLSSLITLSSDFVFCFFLAHFIDCKVSRINFQVAEAGVFLNFFL